MFNFKLQKNKIFVASALLLSLGTFNFSIGATNAYFRDTKSSVDNIFTAGTLDFSLNNTNTYSSGLVYPTDVVSTSIDISNTGSLNSQYIANTTLSGNDVSACDYVTMTATSPTTTYTGLIKDFTTTVLATTNTTWNFNFTINSNTPPSIFGKTCFFKWNYIAWQDNLPNSSSGFSSAKEKLGSIKIGKAVVLNEILANPSTSSPAPANREFIELYNNSNMSIDVAGWQVSEMSSSTERKYTITTTTGGSNTAVPYGGLTNISSKGWITLLLSDGTALNNSGDTVRLYDTGGIDKLDEYTYTTQKPKGYSYARIPDGVGDWVDPVPTPDGPNEMEGNINEEDPTAQVQTLESGGTISSDTEEQTVDEPEITTETSVVEQEPVVEPAPSVESTPAESASPAVETPPSE